MTGKRRVFGELKLSILEIVHLHAPVSVKQVLKLLGGGDHHTTIMTVLTRLFHKKKINREKRGREYFYWLEKNMPDVKISIFDRLKKIFFGGCNASMVAFLLESDSDIDSEAIAKIEVLLDTIKKEERSS